jgi:regulator of protease activity HflC (stomatin/prohibitin superfamily)
MMAKINTPSTSASRSSRGPFTRVAVLALFVVVIALIFGLVALTTGFDRTQGGEVAVVRNGGPLDNNKVRQVIEPASALTWTGMWSTSHKYPAQQRFYTITSDRQGGDKSGVDVENVPTADGVEVGVEGTVYFTLNTDQAKLKDFDDKYGTRQYRGLDGVMRHPYGDDEGWSSFLDQIVRPVISNDLREEIGSFRCSELQASCALVQNAGGTASTPTTGGAQPSNFNIAKIQNAINTSLAKDLTDTLGGDYIVGVKFNLAKITLPAELQTAINKAQAAFAAVTEAQARVASAKADADANAQRQRGYQSCPACAQIDTLKAIPPTVTTFAPGSGFAITQPPAK